MICADAATRCNTSPVSLRKRRLTADGVDEDVFEIQIHDGDVLGRVLAQPSRDAVAVFLDVRAQDATGALDATDASVARQAVNLGHRLIEDRFDDFLRTLE